MRGKRCARSPRRNAFRPVAALLAVILVSCGVVWGVTKWNAQPENDPAGSALNGSDNADMTKPPVLAEKPADQPETPDQPKEPVPPEPVISLAEETLKTMSLREKVYQMFVVMPSAVTNVKKVTSAGETTRMALEKYPVGGLMYDRSNMVSKEQVQTMLSKSQTYVKIPMILTCDEEGGRVNRLMETVGTTWFGPMLDYQDKGPDTARSNARAIAEDMTDRKSVV